MKALKELLARLRGKATAPHRDGYFSGTESKTPKEVLLERASQHDDEAEGAISAAQSARRRAEKYDLEAISHRNSAAELRAAADRLA